MNARAKVHWGCRETTVRVPARPRRPRSLVRSRPACVLLRAASEDATFRDLIGRRFAVVRSDSAPPAEDPEPQRDALAVPGGLGRQDRIHGGLGLLPDRTARRGGRELAVVVLGGRDEVFSDAAALLNHGFAAYERRTLVEEGEAARERPGPWRRSARRGGRSSSMPWCEWKRAERSSGPSSASPGAAYPPPSGSVVGTLRVTSSGATLGKVPVLVADLASLRRSRRAPGGVGPPAPLSGARDGGRRGLARVRLSGEPIHARVPVRRRG